MTKFFVLIFSFFLFMGPRHAQLLALTHERYWTSLNNPFPLEFYTNANIDNRGIYQIPDLKFFNNKELKGEPEFWLTGKGFFNKKGELICEAVQTSHKKLRNLNTFTKKCGPIDQVFYIRDYLNGYNLFVKKVFFNEKGEKERIAQVEIDGVDYYTYSNPKFAIYSYSKNSIRRKDPYEKYVSEESFKKLDDLGEKVKSIHDHIKEYGFKYFNLSKEEVKMSDTIVKEKFSPALFKGRPCWRGSNIQFTLAILNKSNHRFFSQKELKFLSENKRFKDMITNILKTYTENPVSRMDSHEIGSYLNLQVPVVNWPFQSMDLNFEYFCNRGVELAQFQIKLNVPDGELPNFPLSKEKNRKEKK